MAYDFFNLSPADFEDLTADLIGRELGIRFEVFAAGPDGGADGRHTRANKSTILQAKHFARSPYSALKSKMAAERVSVDKLKPSRYLFATSCPITASNKAELKSILGPAVLFDSDIKGPGDLNGLLRSFPDIEKSHVKLWLSSAAMLERLVHSSVHTFNALTKAEIEAKIRVFAPNPSFDEALAILESRHVLIISGPPGVGKTTLAEMLAYAYIGKDWELVAIRSLDDGFKFLDDSKKRVFFFDDFLGKVALDKQALAHKDSDLARFIKRIRASPNTRFILTTRAYIFEEARRHSEHLADERLDVSKYVLDVGIYTRRVKARILYNHLLIAETPPAYIAALIKSGDLRKIVDHKNYNPRVIEWMTDANHIRDIDPMSYPAAFLAALANPSALWDIAFSKHISKACQHLLFAMFFSSQYGVDIADLRITYEKLHPQLCISFGDAWTSKDFEEALKILEGGFITIANQTVNFINPSLRDYLGGYLRDSSLLTACAKAAQQTDWARSIWDYSQGLPPTDRKKLALAFLAIAEDFKTSPVWSKTLKNGITRLMPRGLSNTGRISLLLEWWEATQDQRFWDIAISLATAPVDGLDSWRDGEEAIELIGKLRDGFYFFEELPDPDLLADRIEASAIPMIRSNMPIDELEKIADAMENWPNCASDEMTRALDYAIRTQFEEITAAVAEIESESTLEDHIGSLKKLGDRAAIDITQVELAVSYVTDRIHDVARIAAGVQPSAPEVRTPNRSDQFDDNALNGLFIQLLQ